VTSATPIREEPVRTPSALPVDADATIIFRAFQEAHDAVEPVVCTLGALEAFGGWEPELYPITDEHLAALTTIRVDLANHLTDLAEFLRRLDAGVALAVTIRAEQAAARDRVADETVVRSES